MLAVADHLIIIHAPYYSYQKDLFHDFNLNAIDSRSLA